MSQQVDWDVPGRHEEFRKLWDEGLSLTKIAAKLSLSWRMNVSKNAVIGKAHRLDFPPRASPIIRGAMPAPKPVQTSVARRSINTLAQLGGEAAPVKRPVIIPAQPAPEPEPIEPAPPRFAHAGGYVADDGRRMRPTGCCWPIWEHGERAGQTPRFCDGPHEIGKPYCDEHRAMSLGKSRVQQPEDKPGAPR